MDISKISILSNVYAGSGKERVLELTRQVFECLEPQVSEIFVGPGDMGEVVCQGDKVVVIGDDSTRTRLDSINTAKEMVEKGTEMFVIISGDGTYNDVLEGMKGLGVTLPIFGIAAGRFNVIFPKRKHNPFVSMRGDFKPFLLKDLIIEDVPGMISRVNDEIVSYGFFWVTVANIIAHSDADDNLIAIDAGKYIQGEVVQIEAGAPIAKEETEVTLHSAALGQIELSKGPELSMPIVAHLVPEINQIMSAGFGALADVMGFHGVALVFPTSKIGFLPTPDLFPIETKSVAFFEGDKIHMSNLIDGAVLQADSTAIRQLAADDLLTVEVVLKLAKKAILPQD